MAAYRRVYDLLTAKKTGSAAEPKTVTRQHRRYRAPEGTLYEELIDCFACYLLYVSPLLLVLATFLDFTYFKNFLL